MFSVPPQMKLALFFFLVLGCLPAISLGFMTTMPVPEEDDDDEGAPPCVYESPCFIEAHHAQIDHIIEYGTIPECPFIMTYLDCPSPICPEDESVAGHLTYWSAMQECEPELCRDVLDLVGDIERDDTMCNQLTGFCGKETLFEAVAHWDKKENDFFHLASMCCLTCTYGSSAMCTDILDDFLGSGTCSKYSQYCGMPDEWYAHPDIYGDTERESPTFTLDEVCCSTCGPPGGP